MMDSEIANYIATACGAGFVAASAIAVLAMVKLNRADRELKRLLGEQRLHELRLLSKARTQDAQQHTVSWPNTAPPQAPSAK